MLFARRLEGLTVDVVVLPVRVLPARQVVAELHAASLPQWGG